MVRSWCALYILILKCASRHNGVYFFDIVISKSGPNLVNALADFDFQTCFALQRRATFHHLNFPKMVFAPPELFSEPIFQSSGTTKPEKHNVSRFSYLFVHLHLLSSDLFSSDVFSPADCLFHLSILSEVWLPNFFRITILLPLYYIVMLYYIILYCIILYYIKLCAWYYYIIILLYYYIMTIMILLYYNIIILLYYYRIILWYYDIIIFLYYYIIISLYHYIMYIIII